MDISSGKRSVGWNSTLRKKSSSATRGNSSSRDETAQFCNRIGCNGRLNHTKHAQNDLRSFSRSSFAKELETNLKKRELSSQVKIKSKARETESNKGVPHLKPVGRTVDVTNSNTNIRKVFGKKPGLTNKDGQTGLVEHGRRSNIVKRRSTEGETGSSARGSGGLSVRTRRFVNVNGNNPSPIQSTTRVTPDNVDAIANVLLALERIDQNEGLTLTYERISGNSFLGGFSFYDQYREMRLDIDNMSYEELLALEDEMGIVSTALSKEELSKCLRISIYKPLHMKEGRMRGNWCLGDTKCSICQEEFIAGDEIGRVRCDHGYHVVCINQWLRLKNWCPVCKASVKPSDC